MVAVTAPHGGEKLDVARLREVLPHGPGMLLLDRVEAVWPGRKVRARKAISVTEPCYRNLEPGSRLEDYAYPASLLLESFGQAAAVLWLHSGEVRLSGQVLMFVATRDCAFPGSAYPGDVLCHVAELEHRSDGAAFVSGTTTVDSRLIASYGSVTAVVRPRTHLTERSSDHA